MKLSLISLSILFCSFIVFATDSLTTTIDTIITNVTNVVQTVNSFNMNTKFVGIWLVIAAVIKLLISLMKFKQVAKWLDTTKMKPFKPYFSLILGIIGSVAVSATTNQSWLVNLIAGITAGFGATGIHETLKSVRGKNT